MTTTNTRTKLTAKQEAFCVFYFTSRHGTDSAIKAGYSPKSAYAIAEENLNKPDIQARLAEIQAGVVPDVAQVQADFAERLQILAKIARHQVEMPVTAGHVTQAVAEINKMEHIYEAGGNIRNINVVFVIGRGYRESPQVVEVAGGAL